jgi:hypothetical protein
MFTTQKVANSLFFLEGLFLGVFDPPPALFRHFKGNKGNKGNSSFPFNPILNTRKYVYNLYSFHIILIFNQHYIFGKVSKYMFTTQKVANSLFFLEGLF